MEEGRDRSGKEFVEAEAPRASGDEERPALSVLVVDDDPVFRELLVLAFRTRGVEARGAANGAAALQAIGQARPDAVVLDLLMPVMDGLSFLRALKDREQSPVPVVVLTCLEERSHVVDALVAGASEVLTKPVALDELLAKVEALA
jgi:two-component system response regulator MprA